MDLLTEYQATAAEIISLRDADLALREKLIRNGQLGVGYNEEMKRLHLKNANALDSIINRIGYPTIEKVGKEANKASWLVIQHAISLPKFMKKCASLLANAVAKKQADAIDLAYLTDRIAMFEGKPQLYGTQFDWDEHGNMIPNFFDDLLKVNERRVAIGLNLLQEQTALINERVKAEKQLPPIDFEKRKQEMMAWKKAVGWVK